MESKSLQQTIITSETDSVVVYLKKIWKYKTLISVFAKRDIKVKYSQTFLGLGWTILQPLTAVLIFTFFFGYILDWKAGHLPYSLYVLSGLLGWNFFSYIVFQGTASVQEAGQVIKKVYFPKAVLPLSKVLVALVELGISFLLIIPLLIIYGQMVSWHIIFFPVVVVLNSLLALFVVFTAASIAYKLRDIIHVIPFIVSFGIWCTPVFFTKNILPETINFVWYLNPMAAIVELWRWCFFQGWNYDIFFLPALLIIFPLFFIGLFLYSKFESRFSDFV